LLLNIFLENGAHSYYNVQSPFLIKTQSSTYLYENDLLIPLIPAGKSCCDSVLIMPL